MDNVHNYDVKLYKNNLSEVANAYYARPATERTLSLTDVCKSAVSRGDASFSVKKMSVAVEEWFEEAVYQMMNGFAINNGYILMYLTMEGNFDGPKDSYDETRHKLKVKINPTAGITDELENVVVNVVGAGSIDPEISEITDMYTGNVDSTMSPGWTLCINGERLKIVGDDESCGVDLISTTDGTTTHLTGVYIMRNEPAQLWVMVPTDLAAGEYSVRVTTQFSSQNYTLKSPRTVTYKTALTVA